ncbi:acyl-CoA dehydrogenase family protein [Micromonospora endolithica]|uniref:Acyl-CoA dehydrogenase n=1 Tax=Micromonospora endolithica TaxID=230091 RepID=A0A3A9ZG76_9ACTN|nr:acyl-CoA dehydrogenase family protein [Micromonospora endolithica]RKN47511.1 acyl-CoA dehydrogenase [Micromonospora endolithica]TWJ21147.1 clorobiocin biosynthesis protein CloN3 [Micromonospora endolithica]
MEFELSAGQRKLYDEIHDQVAERLGNTAAATGVKQARAAFAAAAATGVTGLCLPTGSGGAGLGALDTALGLEAFGRACPETGLTFAVAAHLLACAVPIRDHATDTVRERLLSGLAAGKIIAANAMSEDEAGSDVGALTVTARADGGAYVIDGEKSWASNAPIADLIVTYAVTDPRAGFLGVSAFAVPRDLPGVAVGEPLDKLGLAGCLAGRVRFDGCRVPREYLLGAEGQGSALFQHSMAWERACLFAIYVGLMDRQLAMCVRHAGRRRQFGRRIGEFQAVSHRIATMKQRLEGARLLLYRACWLLDRGRDHVEAAALSKVAVSEAVVANSLDAFQIFGSAGYLTGSGVAEQVRDSLPSSLFSGTNEIQRELIAKGLGL